MGREAFGVEGADEAVAIADLCTGAVYFDFELVIAGAGLGLLNSVVVGGEGEE